MISITDFIKDKNVSAAISPAVEAALAGDRHLYFPPGEYHFYPEGCVQRYCFFSNNDEGVKTIAVLLENIQDFTISGKDARWIFHGRISPVCAFDCRNLTVEGITIDFEDSFVSDADLIRRENGVAWFNFPGKHKVVNGRIVFTDDFYDNFHGKLPFYSYDREKNELVFDSKVISVPNANILSRDGLVGVEDRFENVVTDAFLVKHEIRFCPGMCFDSCENVRVINTTIHHAAGMGLLIQQCNNCTVDGLRVVPGSRRAAVSDDALHITDCRGKLQILNCDLSGTLDDSINVHGVFRKLKSRIPGGKMYYLEAGHYQQQGVFNIRPGDTLELLTRATGKPGARVRINEVIPCNKAFSILKIDENDLPAAFVQGDPGWILETRADLEVINCSCRPLDGRGILASGMRSVRIANCNLHCSGAGVFISGDHGFWYESGPVENAVIEDNFFDNCNYCLNKATQEPFAVFPELEELEEGFYYHGKITVRNNRFRNAVRPLISMKSVRDAVVTGNTFEADDTYLFVPNSEAGYFFTSGDSPMAAFLHCENITDENNHGFIK